MVHGSPRADADHALLTGVSIVRLAGTVFLMCALKHGAAWPHCAHYASSSYELIKWFHTSCPFITAVGDPGLFSIFDLNTLIPTNIIRRRRRE